MTTPTAPAPSEPQATAPSGPLALLRTRRYIGLLVLAALLGRRSRPSRTGFLKLVDLLQKEIFTSLPSGPGLHGEPLWWPQPAVLQRVQAAGSGLHELAERERCHGAAATTRGWFRLLLPSGWCMGAVTDPTMDVFIPSYRGRRDRGSGW